jgi:chromosome segregation ATPase
MSALVREQFDWEVLVAANEAVLEERIKFIQENVGEARAELQELRAANKALDEKVDRKTDDLAAHIHALRDRLEQKTDALAAEDKEIRKEMAQGFEKVNTRIDEKTDSLAEAIGDVAKELSGVAKQLAGMQGTVKATFLIASIVTTLVTLAGILVGIAQALQWLRGAA